MIAMHTFLYVQKFVTELVYQYKKLPSRIFTAHLNSHDLGPFEILEESFLYW